MQWAGPAFLATARLRMLGPPIHTPTLPTPAPPACSNVSRNRLTGRLPDAWRALHLLTTIILGHNRQDAVLGSVCRHSRVWALPCTRAGQLACIAWPASGNVPACTFWIHYGVVCLRAQHASPLAPIRAATDTMRSGWPACCRLSGTLPTSWAERGAMPALRALQLQHNSIGGTLPPEWSAPSAMPQLRDIHLQASRGQLGRGWG